MDLYHYTSFESAIKILVSHTILFSKIETLNDINESAGPMLLSQNSTQEAEKIQKLLNHYRQISLTTDTAYKKGYDIPAMWGHYGNRGHGACIVLDKNNIAKEIRRRGFYSREIKYSDKILTNDYEYVASMHGSLENFIKRAKDAIFFNKTTDWKYEQEYRIIALNEHIKPLSISKSLKAIILYARNHDEFINSIEYKTISKIIDESIEIYRYTTSFHKGLLYDIHNNCINEIKYEFKSISGFNNDVPTDE